MSRCSMSFIQLEKYLNFILTRRLLVVEHDGPYLFFKISSKGRRFLEIYENLKTLIDEEHIGYGK